MAINEENTRVTITMSKKLKRALDVITKYDDKSLSKYISEILEPKAMGRIEHIKKEKLDL